uniref:Uncharacterized protein n=1 Tax=Mastacembelus armatus TaxID=205130 RepID=A0A3Q3SFR6_9TELE
HISEETYITLGTTVVSQLCFTAFKLCLTLVGPTVYDLVCVTVSLYMLHSAVSSSEKQQGQSA